MAKTNDELLILPDEIEELSAYSVLQHYRFFI
jgi:hypothetical protein